MGLYKSLSTRASNEFGIDEAPYLCGFTLGNSRIPGCLTDDQTSRVHSCELGIVCSVISSGHSVKIIPIVTRTENGYEVPELGAGGGIGDLYQSHELELSDDSTFRQLANLCAELIPDQNTRLATIEALSIAYKSNSKSLSLDSYGMKEEEDISLRELVRILSHGPPKDSLPGSSSLRMSTPSTYSESQSGSPLPNIIVRTTLSITQSSLSKLASLDFRLI
jgi:DNA cross-link repair 1C protein